MKKIAKNSVVAMILFILLFSLTACGGEKLVATIEEDGMKQTIEFKFKNEIADEVKITFEAESEKDAKEGKEFFEKQLDGAKVKQSGKKVIITTTMEKYSKFLDIDYEKNKDNLKKDKLTESLKKAGYTIK